MFRRPRVTSPILRSDRLRPFLEHLEDRTVPATINGTAFFDSVTPNGIRDAGEGPAAGVQVTILGSQTTVTTDANGWYAFIGPLQGGYQLRFTPPSGYTIGMPMGGVTGGYIQSTDVTVNAALVATSGGSTSPSWSMETDTDEFIKAEEISFWVWTDADPWPSISSYEWDFDYNGTFVPDAGGGTDWETTKTFTTVGNHTVAARLTDNQGHSEIVTESVSVEYAPPDVTMPADMTAVAGTPTTLSVQATSEVGIDHVEWWFSFEGDDYYEDESSTTLTTIHTFDEAGEYDAWFVVYDTAGKSSDGWFHISVSDAAPNEQVTMTDLNNQPIPNGIDEGATVTFTVNDLSVDDLDNNTLYVDWTGDGIFEQLNQAGGDYVQDPTDPKKVSFTHLYDDDGTFAPHIQLQDEWGTYDYDPLTLAVHNVAPTATVTAGVQFATLASSNQDVWAIEPNENMEITAFDPSDADSAVLQYHWIITGTSNGTKNYSETLTDVSSMALPMYEAGTTYRVEAFVTDKNGGESPHTTFTVVVDDPQGYGWTIGSHWLPNKVYGTFSVDGITAAPQPVYNRYALDINITPPADPSFPNRENYGHDPITAHFTLDDASQQLLANHPDWHVDYRFAVATYNVTQHWLWDDDHELVPEKCIYIHGSASTVTTPFGFLDDEAIIVSGAADILDANNQLVQTTSTADFERNGGNSFDSVALLHQPMAVLITHKTGTWVDQAIDIWQSVKTLAQQFGSHAGQLLDLVSTDPGRQRVYNVLTQAFNGAITQFGQTLPVTLRQKLATWLGGGVDLSKFASMDWSNVNNWGNYLLDYAGLNWNHVYDVVRRQLGEGNLIALQQAYAWFNETTSDPNAFRTLLTKMQDTMTDLQQAAAGLDPNTFIGDLVDKIAGQIPAALTRAGANFAAKFVPGAGLAISLYDGLRWVLDNQTQLADLFQKFLSAIDDLAASTTDAVAVAAVQTKLLDGFNLSVGALLPLAATQLGLARLPQELKQVLSFVPARVDAAIRKAVDTVASAALANMPGVMGGTKPNKLFDGMLASPREFQYPETNGKTYILWSAQDKLGVHVRIAEKTAPGVYKLIGELGAGSFTTAAAQQHMGQFISAAMQLHQASKQSTGSTNPLINLQQKQLAVATPTPPAPGAPLTSAEDLVVADIKANACKILSAGCFAAGTRLWTPEGYRKIEEIQPGEKVYSRDESSPGSLIRAKVVEERFVRFAGIIHLHVSGEVIRTTGEHPFYARGEGWKPVKELREGDQILTASGEWVVVEEVYDTGEWEEVYNLRVADFHTYFVGDEGWGFAAWAHNTACIGDYGTLAATTGYEKHHIGQDAAMSSLRDQGYTYSSSLAPAITLFGGNSFIGSAHYEATQEQRRRNAALRATRATQMTISQQADIAYASLQAALNAQYKGMSSRQLTQSDVTRAMDAFWSYVADIGATGSTLIRIPSR